MKKIIFMGTPEFSKTVLQALLNENKYEIVAVVTQPDRPVGRKRVLTASPVKTLAQCYDIPVFQPEKLSGSPEMQRLIELNADLIVTAAYGQFVPTKLLKAPKYHAINVHASLLPKYRGGAPIHYAIWNGDEETGVTIMYMEKEMDAGDILAQKSTPIHFNDDVGQLFERLSHLGAELLLDTLPKLFSETITPIEQNQEEVTYSPTITKEQEEIDWNQTAKQIHDHVRAFRPFPSTYTILNGERLKIWAGLPQMESVVAKGQPGEIVDITPEGIAIQCGEGIYWVTELQPSGKKRMTSRVFVNGQSQDVLLHQICQKER